jgi:CRP/FNR family transcriptional regulator, polysaccharide utilization system transcription regulator
MKRAVIDIPTCNDCENKSGVLCSLSEENKTLLSERKGDNFYKKGQAIFYEGNQANGLFCIHSGKVKLSKLGEDGKEQIVRFAKTADILGYRSLLSDEPYQATATVMEDSYICLVSKEKFMNLMDKDSKLSLNVIKLLSADLKGAERLLINIAQKSVKERISEALVILKNVFGFDSDEKTLDVSLTRAEIADMAGTTTETTIRTLAQLNTEGLIALEGKKIQILDFKGLIRQASMYD